MSTINEETSVLKKVGMVAAAATAGMLALSPLAFAHDGYGDRDRDRDRNETTAFAFEDDSVERNQVNLCEFDQDSTILPSTVVGAILPGVVQDQNNNCVNVGDGSEYEPEAEVIPPPVVPPVLP
jgi:hypothetical protein